MGKLNIIGIFLLLISCLLTVPGRASAALDDRPVLSGLAIEGPLKVFSNSTARYRAVATYSDGTWREVVPSWSVNSDAAAMDAGGNFRSGEVSGHTSVMVRAGYSEGGVMKSAMSTVLLSALLARLQAAEHDADSGERGPGGAASSATGRDRDISEPPNKPCLIFDDRTDSPVPAKTGSEEGWLPISGRWTIGADGMVSEDQFSANRMIVKDAPPLDHFTAGRLQTFVELTDFGRAPNGGIIFGFVDAKHYRYAKIDDNRMVIGQVGDYAGEQAGIKAERNVAMPLNTWEKLIVDLNPDGSVSARVAPAGNTDPDGNVEVLCYRFKQQAAGAVGYSAVRSRTRFGDFRAWDQAALEPNR